MVDEDRGDGRRGRHPVDDQGRTKPAVKDANARGDQIAAANAPPAASDASAACFQTGKALGITVTRTRSGYLGQATGTTRKLSGRLPLNMSCRRLGKGLRFTLRPSARGAKLRQLVGPKLSLGFVNPTKKSLRINTTYAFK